MEFLNVMKTGVRQFIYFFSNIFYDYLLFVTLFSKSMANVLRVNDLYDDLLLIEYCE